MGDSFWGCIGLSYPVTQALSRDLGFGFWAKGSEVDVADFKPETATVTLLFYDFPRIRLKRRCSTPPDLSFEVVLLRACKPRRLMEDKHPQDCEYF